MRLCKDCRFFAPSDQAEHIREWSKCRAKARTPAHDSAIDGAHIPATYWYADVMRSEPFDCGPDAKLFEPK